MRIQISPALAMCCLALLPIEATQAAPTLEQTQNYIIEKTDTSWKKKRNRLLIQQSISFPSNCEIQVVHQFRSLKNPETIFVDEVALVPIKEIYKLVTSGRNISVRLKPKSAVRQNTYYPAERKHKKYCEGSSEPCTGPSWKREQAAVHVIPPGDLYREKVGKALSRMMELCSAGKELF